MCVVLLFDCGTVALTSSQVIRVCLCRVLWFCSDSIKELKVKYLTNIFRIMICNNVRYLHRELVLLFPFLQLLAKYANSLLPPTMPSKSQPSKSAASNMTNTSNNNNINNNNDNNNNQGQNQNQKKSDRKETYGIELHSFILSVMSRATKCKKISHHSDKIDIKFNEHLNRLRELSLSNNTWNQLYLDEYERLLLKPYNKHNIDSHQQHRLRSKSNIVASMNIDGTHNNTSESVTVIFDVAKITNNNTTGDSQNLPENNSLQDGTVSQIQTLANRSRPNVALNKLNRTVTSRGIHQIVILNNEMNILKLSWYVSIPLIADAIGLSSHSDFRKWIEQCKQMKHYYLKRVMQLRQILMNLFYFKMAQSKDISKDVRYIASCDNDIFNQGYKIAPESQRNDTRFTLNTSATNSMNNSMISSSAGLKQYDEFVEPLVDKSNMSYYYIDSYYAIYPKHSWLEESTDVTNQWIIYETNSYEISLKATQKHQNCDCSITPSVGLPLADAFDLTISDWVDIINTVYSGTIKFVEARFGIDVIGVHAIIVNECNSPQETNPITQFSQSGPYEHILKDIGYDISNINNNSKTNNSTHNSSSLHYELSTMTVSGTTCDILVTYTDESLNDNDNSSSTVNNSKTTDTTQDPDDNDIDEGTTIILDEVESLIDLQQDMINVSADVSLITSEDTVVTIVPANNNNTNSSETVDTYLKNVTAVYDCQTIENASTVVSETVIGAMIDANDVSQDGDDDALETLNKISDTSLSVQDILMKILLFEMNELRLPKMYFELIVTLIGLFTFVWPNGTWFL